MSERERERKKERGKKRYFLGENFSLKFLSLSLLRSVFLHHPRSSLFLSVSSCFGFLYRKFLLLMNFFTPSSYPSLKVLYLKFLLFPSQFFLSISERKRERERGRERESLWFVFPIRSLLPSFSAFNVIPGGFI